MAGEKSGNPWQRINEAGLRAEDAVNGGILNSGTDPKAALRIPIPSWLNPSFTASAIGEERIFRDVASWGSPPEEEQRRLASAVVEIGKRIDGIQVFGLHLTDFFGGMAVGWTSRNLAKAALVGLTGGVSIPAAIAAGGIAGVVTGAAREYIKQVRQNIKEAPAPEQGKLRLREKLRIRNGGELALAAGKGGLMGLFGATVGTYVIENWHDLGNNFKHFAGEQWDKLQHLAAGGGLIDQSPTPSATPTTSLTPDHPGAGTDINPTASPTATPSAEPTHTATPTASPTESASATPTDTVTPTETPTQSPTPTYTPSPTETLTPTQPSDPLPPDGITPNDIPIDTPAIPNTPLTNITSLLHQDIQIEPGKSLWGSIDIPQGWVNSANDVSQSDVIKNMIGLFAEANGHDMTEIPSGAFSFDSLGLTPEQIEIIEAASKTTDVEDYRIHVLPHFQALLNKVSSN